jgi:tetratricopeptide (TPR) repeat protein
MSNNLFRHFAAFLLFVSLFIVSCLNRGKDEIGTGTGVDSTRLNLEELTKRIGSDASDPALYKQRAKVYLLDHQFDKALNDINKAISIDPSGVAYYVTLSDIYLLMGQPEKTREALAKALALEPGNNESLLKMARLNLIIKDYKGTFEYVGKCLDAEPLNPRAYYIRAIAMLESGDTVKAVDDLKRAVDQDQQYFEAYVELGELYSLRKDNMAAAYYGNALRIKPGNKEVLYMLGMFYQESGQYEKALETYTQLETVDTTLRTAPFNRGYIYLVYLKEFSRAAEMFTKAIRADPEYYEAYFNRGYAFELMGDLHRAYGDYQNALKIKPNYPNAVDGLNRLDRVMGGKH